MNSAEVVKGVETENDEASATRQEDVAQCILYVDDTSNENGPGAGMMLINAEGHKIHYSLHFGFSTLNNEVEYVAFITGLRLTKKLQAHHLKIYSDSQLVVNQVNNIYLAIGERMAAYLKKAKGLMKTIPKASI